MDMGLVLPTDPLRAVAPDLFLPDRNDLLEPIDGILARRECLAPMRRGDGDGHRGLADLEHARAMDDRHLGYRPAGFHLIADLGHYLFGHLGVSLIFEVNDVAPTRKSAGDAAK